MPARAIRRRLSVAGDWFVESGFEVIWGRCLLGLRHHRRRCQRHSLLAANTKDILKNHKVRNVLTYFLTLVATSRAKTRV